MDLDRVTVTANINTFSGYGMATCEIIRGLVAAGIDVNVRAIAKTELFGAKIPLDISSRFVSRVQPDEWETLIHPPDFVPTPGKKTAYFTMWESTRLRQDGLNLLKRASLIITPSAWNAACFNASGIDVPIRIVPLGINPDVFHYRPMQSDGIVFGTAGRMAHGGTRKGIEDVIATFRRTFPEKKYPEVRLRIKAFDDCKIADVPDKRIDVTRKFLSNRDLAGWLGSLTCFVSATRGEGWGLLQHEAMAVGRPVIAPIYGGLAEFMDRSNSYPVDYRTVTANGFYDGCGFWCEPDLAMMGEQMMKVHRNPDAARKTGVLASFSAEQFTWVNTIRKLIGVYREFGIISTPRKR